MTRTDIDKTTAAVTRLAARDELCDITARLAVVRDELRRFAPDALVDGDLTTLGTIAGFAVSQLGKTYEPRQPTPVALCRCGHTAGEHVIRGERVTVCGECGCAGWDAR